MCKKGVVIFSLCVCLKILKSIAINLNVLFLDVCKTSYGKHAENKE